MMLFIHSVSHFLVDALSVTILFSQGAEGELLTLALVLYNTLAFSTQCLVGLLIDSVRPTRIFTAAAMLTIVLGFLLPMPFLLRIGIAAIGNSFFHVAAGKITLETSGNSARSLGIFVAPGALGVTLGTNLPEFAWPLCAAMLLSAVIILCTPTLFSKSVPSSKPSADIHSGFPLLPVLLLCCAVAIRALGGSVIDFPWKQGLAASFILTCFIFFGKFLGGFICDRLGASYAAWITIPLAAICLCFFSKNMALSLFGQLLLNLSMPITLWLLYKLGPDAPGFAFGLAASALWPGTIVGLLFRLTGPLAQFCALTCMAFSLFAIIYAARYIKRKEKITR